MSSHTRLIVRSILTLAALALPDCGTGLDCGDGGSACCFRVEADHATWTNCCVQPSECVPIVGVEIGAWLTCGGDGDCAAAPGTRCCAVLFSARSRRFASLLCMRPEVAASFGGTCP